LLSIWEGFSWRFAKKIYCKLNGSTVKRSCLKTGSGSPYRDMRPRFSIPVRKCPLGEISGGVYRYSNRSKELQNDEERDSIW
jgi:hypothetical protein